MTVAPQPAVIATLYALATMILTSGQILRRASMIVGCRLTSPSERESAARPLQILFGGFDVLDGAGLEPLAVMR